MRTGKVRIHYDTTFHARTATGAIRFEKFVNAAGAHADRIARHFGLGGQYAAAILRVIER